MKKKRLLRKCPNCGGTGFRETSVDHEIRVGTTVAWAGIPAAECLSCHERFADGPALVQAELAMAQMLSHYAPTPDAFRFLRAVLRMKAGELADLFDVAPETVSRWENGKRAIDPASWAHLCGMLKDRIEERTTTWDRLREAKAARGKRAPKRLRLKFKLAT